MRLQGKVALVTGAASGIGHAVAALFFKESAIVFASDIASPDPAYSAGINALKLDVTSEDDWAKSGGEIVNISSIWGSAPGAGTHSYRAAKGAVRDMSKSAATTYVADGIRVNSVHPGFIDTPHTRAQAKELNDAVNASTPMKRGGKPIEVAYGCRFPASDEASYVTGTELVIDGGCLAQ